jgi:hypothetical protein
MGKDRQRPEVHLPNLPNLPDLPGLLKNIGPAVPPDREVRGLWTDQRDPGPKVIQRSLRSAPSMHCFSMMSASVGLE